MTTISYPLNGYYRESNNVNLRSNTKTIQSEKISTGNHMVFNKVSALE